MERMDIDRRRQPRRSRHNAFAICGLLLILAFYAGAAAGSQESTLDSSQPETTPAPNSENSRALTSKTPAEDANSSSKRGSLVIAPIPISSPAVGNGATILAGYIFPLRKSDTVSPASVIGGAWVGTDNGTRAWAGAAELYFNQDRYHVVTGYAHADLNYDFYGTGTIGGDAGVKFGLNQTGDVFFAEALRRTFWQIFVGPRLWFGTSRLKPQHLNETHPNLPPFDVELGMNSLGFKIERDTVPNRFYPEAGTLFRFGSDFFAKELGGTYTFQRYRLTFNTYRSFGTKQVLAYNLFACSTGGEAPFFGQCIFGLQNELRGYPAGRYIDMNMLATQAEYRLRLPWRLGVAAFVGVGEVASGWSDFNAGNLLPSGGIGPRFELSRKYHVNLRTDFAWGKNGRTFSMGLGESF